MGNELSLLQRGIFPLCCNTANACRYILFQRSQEASLKKFGIICGYQNEKLSLVPVVLGETSGRV